MTANCQGKRPGFIVKDAILGCLCHAQSLSSEDWRILKVLRKWKSSQVGDESSKFMMDQSWLHQR